MTTSDLQRKSVLCGGGFRYHCSTAMPLSVKSFSGDPIAFIQTVTPDDGQIKPRLQTIDLACRGKTVPEDWLEDQLRELLAALLLSQREHRAQANRLPAAKTVTRDELYRRLCRGRDYLHAYALSAPTLDQAARAASLSPFHFQRSFKAAFGLSPRQYAEARRLAHARRLLGRADASATSVASEVGYESYSSFHAAFRRQFGYPPSAAI